MASVKRNRASYDIGPHKEVYVGTKFVIANSEQLQMLRYFTHYKQVYLVLVGDNYHAEIEEQGYAHAVIARPEDVELAGLDNITHEKAEV